MGALGSGLVVSHGPYVGARRTIAGASTPFAAAVAMTQPSAALLQELR